MDAISTALTAAWLDAVRRVQSEAIQNMQKAMPQSVPGHDERTLTDVIERGLKHGGAEPVIVEPTGPTGNLVDLHV